MILGVDGVLHDVLGRIHRSAPDFHGLLRIGGRCERDDAKRKEAHGGAERRNTSAVHCSLQMKWPKPIEIELHEQPAWLITFRQRPIRGRNRKGFRLESRVDARLLTSA